MKDLLNIKKVYFYYGKAKALEEINLNIKEKALEAVIGPNGAGKSTLLRVISGLEEPDRGKIEFLGERIDDLKGMLKNPNLTKEQSMELQYWLRENTMARGEEK